MSPPVLSMEMLLWACLCRLMASRYVSVNPSTSPADIIILNKLICSYVYCDYKTFFKLPRLLVESECFDVVSITLVSTRIGQHLSVYSTIHNLCVNNVFGSTVKRFCLVQSVMVEYQSSASPRSNWTLHSVWKIVNACLLEHTLYIATEQYIHNTYLVFPQR